MRLPPVTFLILIFGIYSQAQNTIKCHYLFNPKAKVISLEQKIQNQLHDKIQKQIDEEDEKEAVLNQQRSSAHQMRISLNSTIGLLKPFFSSPNVDFPLSQNRLWKLVLKLNEYKTMISVWRWDGLLEQNTIYSLDKSVNTIEELLSSQMANDTFNKLKYSLSPENPDQILEDLPKEQIEHFTQLSYSIYKIENPHIYFTQKQQIQHIVDNYLQFLETFKVNYDLNKYDIESIQQTTKKLISSLSSHPLWVNEQKLTRLKALERLYLSSNKRILN